MLFGICLAVLALVFGGSAAAPGLVCPRGAGLVTEPRMNEKWCELNGERHGPWKRCLENGQVAAERIHRNGQLHGTWRVYDSETGALVGETQYRNGTKDGRARTWFTDGSIKSQGYYIDGKLHGEGRTWHPNGQLKEYKNWTRGVLEGSFERYYATGQIVTGQ